MQITVLSVLPLSAKVTIRLHRELRLISSDTVSKRRQESKNQHLNIDTQPYQEPPDISAAGYKTIQIMT